MEQKHCKDCDLRKAKKCSKTGQYTARKDTCETHKKKVGEQK